MLEGCSNLANLNIGSNTFSNAPDSLFNGIGTTAGPCTLTVSSDFDSSVLGEKTETDNGGYYQWKRGYFALASEEPTAVNGIIADDASNDYPAYNLSGQRVGKHYKGIVISNGKKHLRK